MDSSINKTYKEIDSILDIFLENSQNEKETKSLVDLINEYEKKNKLYFSFQSSHFNESQRSENKNTPLINERLDEIVTLISENSIKSTDFSKLHKNQEKILVEIKSVQKQNDVLLQEIYHLKKQNKILKEILKKNTTDKRIRSVASSFLIFFSFSLLLYYISNFEMVQIFWTKLGIIISLGVYLIGFFIGKMIKNIKVDDR